MSYFIRPSKNYLNFIARLRFNNAVNTKPFSILSPVSLQLQNNNIIDYLSNAWATIWDGLLYAAPKKRRSIQQRRWLRKFKALKPRNDIEDCLVCGNKKLQGRLCKHCFEWTMSLTEKVWEKTGKNKIERFVR